MTSYSLMKVESIAECSPWSNRYWKHRCYHQLSPSKADQQQHDNRYIADQPPSYRNQRWSSSSVDAMDSAVSLCDGDQQRYRLI